MLMQKINTDKAPAAIGPYSQAVIVNGVLYTSGQIPIDPASGQVVEGVLK
jgi:2-iminobutanoate/2-iminopropanoate deaminase